MTLVEEFSPSTSVVSC